MISLRNHDPSPYPQTEPNTTALDRLVADMNERRKGGEVIRDFGEFEKRLHARVLVVEREILREGLPCLDG